jgi:hypothetical protein
VALRLGVAIPTSFLGGIGIVSGDASAGTSQMGGTFNILAEDPTGPYRTLGTFRSWRLEATEKLGLATALRKSLSQARAGGGPANA